MTKTNFITGSSSGIGNATAKHFAETGWNVAATDESDTIRYLSGKDAEQFYSLKKENGDVSFAKMIKQTFLGKE